MKRKFLSFAHSKVVHTVGAAGDFDESEQLEFMLKAEEIWADGKFADDLIPHADAAVYQLNKQTAKFRELDNPDKDNQVKVTWVKSCGIDTDDFTRSTDTCEISGDELESASKTYAYDHLQKVGFSIDEEKLRTNTYSKEELIAHGMMKMDKQLSEWWAKKLLLFLSSNAGANVAAIQGKVNPFTWDGGDNTTMIPDANYNNGMVALLIKQQILNLAKSGWYLEDGTLFVDWENAGMNSGNIDGKGDDARTKRIDLNFDMWSFANAGVSENMFLVDRNAVAMKTYTRYADRPEVLGGQVNQTRYRFKSNILPGVYYDVIYVMKCTSGAIKHTFQFMTEGGIFLNPEPCPVTVGETTYTPNGVWSFTKGA